VARTPGALDMPACSRTMCAMWHVGLGMENGARGLSQLLLALGFHFGRDSHKLKAFCNCTSLLEKQLPRHQDGGQSTQMGVQSDPS